MREIPTDIVSPAGRLRRLELLLLEAEQREDLCLAVRILDLAARESRAGPGAGESQEGIDPPDLTPEQARAEIEEFFRKYEANRDRAGSVDLT
jgi:hypothetical protein